MTVVDHRLSSLTGHDPDDYVPHPLHAHDAAYPETNCFADLMIEIVHARGMDPLAMLGHVFRADFEGDQWTFFKPTSDELELLYAIDVHEMQPHRPLPEAIETQLVQGRTVIVELDSWYLPDTRGVGYRSDHIKTAVAPDAIDIAGERLHYFHNGGLWSLGGEDFRGALRLDTTDPQLLPPYTELVRFDRGRPLRGRAQRNAAVRLLRGHLRRRPTANPFVVFGAELEAELPRLIAGDMQDVHDYIFATTRMAGSAFALGAAHVRWLFEGEAEFEAAALDQIVAGCKSLSFRLARRRPFVVGPLVEALARDWDAALAGLAARVG